jgi:hypothetical protein
MSMRFNKAIGLAALGSALLAACGGGGGGGGSASTGGVTPPAGTTFPLATAVANLDTHGYQKNATVSGTASYAGNQYPVTGSATLTESPGGQTTFDAQSALQMNATVTATLTADGQTVNLASSDQGYSTLNDDPIGYSETGTYCVASVGSSFPETVQVGQTGTVVTYACYSDSTKSVPTGTETLSYVISAANSATTATATLIETMVNTANQTTFNAQSNYLIDTSGDFSLVSIVDEETVSGVLLNITFTAQ